MAEGPTCRRCDSTNTEPEQFVAGRQRFKCLDCDILFFDEEKEEEIETVKAVPDEKGKPEEKPAETPEEKIYSCKKCDFNTPEKRKLIGHYSSVHSWWHNEKPEEVKAEMGDKPARESLWMDCLMDCLYELYIEARNRGRTDIKFADVDKLVIKKSKSITEYKAKGE
ncbi:hypothetical protein LCGC14_1019790 [marine sediment metagenome]|uniref:Uncharacterized protein n=1 Tax=marine sediment metagenome TaxID=412755 RepID=A0A0F9R3Q0_9ZZZZ